MNRVPKKVKDITGRRFGRLVVTAFCDTVRGHGYARARWHCLCDCGATTISYSTHLLAGQAMSCGCIQATHRMSNSPEYKIWTGILKRCRNCSSIAFPLYGARGIEVRYANFDEFFADVGRRPGPDYSVDRINNDGHYEPGNCRWATRVEQTNNTRRNRVIEIGGITKTVAQWCRETGVPSAVARRRIQLGWSVEDAVTKEVRR